MDPPKGVIDRIEKIFNKFYWCGVGSSNKIHWSAWSKIAKPKEQGGLGIRRIQDLVKAFALKMWFHFRENNSLWAQFMFSKILRPIA